MNALTAEQQKQATLAFEVRNLVLGPGADGKMIAPEGVRASTFTQAQRKLLMDVAYEWVGILSDDAAAEGAGLSPLAAMMDIDTPMAIRMTARMRFPR